MNLENICKQSRVLNTFVTLAQIPSPSLKENAVIEKVLELLNDIPNIYTEKDSYGNIIAKLDATDNNKKSLLLSAHLDVVGDDSKVCVKISPDLNFFETDKKRTLGADNKCGVAVAIELLRQIALDKDLAHGGIEVVLTRDEEKSMSGIKNLDFSQLNSEYVLVLDADKLGDILVSGAGYYNLKLKVETFKGGHSGIDIDDIERLNATKLITELISKIPQGVLKKDKTGVITSINIGAIISGGVNNAIKNLIDEHIQTNDYQNYLVENAMTNIINTKAQAIYSLRSADMKYQEKIIAQIKEYITEFNKKYENFAQATLDVAEHLKPFEKSNDNFIPQIATRAAEQLKIKHNIASFHAGAETHYYKYQKNASEKYFQPYLIGIADIYNMHSENEMVNIKSLETGFKFLKNIFYIFNQY